MIEPHSVSTFTDRLRARRAGVDGAEGPVAESLARLVAAPSCTSPALSPDGCTLAFVSDQDGVPALWLRSEGGQSLRVDTGTDQVRAVSWSPDGQWLTCLLAPYGGERTRVLALRPDGTGARTLAGGANCAGMLGSWRPDGGSVGVTEAGQHGAWTAYAVDPATGERTELTCGPAAVVCALHPDGQRAVVRVGRRDHRQLLLVDISSGEHTPLLAEADATVATARFAADGRRLYLHTDSGRDRVALLAVPVPATGLPARVPTHEVAARPDADVDLFALHTDRVAVVWNANGYSELEVRGPAGIRELPAPAEVVTSCAFTPDGEWLLLGAEGPAAPPHVLRQRLVDGQQRRVIPIDPPSWAPDELASPVLLSFAAEDGLELAGWWYRPCGAPGPAPTILWLHGGPEAQERPTFAPLTQALVAAGVAVFAPNVRGSTGYGRRFQRADNGDGRFAAIADVAATARFLVDAGLAEPARIGVAGRSYGGYLTLAALVHYPELFGVGVDVCGMADLETFFAHTEPWIAAAATSKYGDPGVHQELLRELSPLHRIDRLIAPLLVVHGKHDTNVPLLEAEQVVNALRQRGAAPGLLLFDDEGHEIHAAANRATFVREVVAWLTDHLLELDEQTA